MLSDITLGQYFPGSSILHKLDPRVKIILSVIFMVAIFSAHSVYCYLLVSAATVLLLLISRISVRVVLRGIRPILYVLIFTMILNLFFTSVDESSRLLVSFWRIRIYDTSIYRSVFMALRVVLLVIGTSVLLTYTTTPIALTDGIESLLSPLKLLRLPVHEFAMMMTIALRFIPTLIEETDKIMNAQKARGADFSNGSLVQRAKALIPILVPLFVSAFQRAIDLATAMECRCYRGGKGRTKLIKLSIGARDVLMLFVFAAFLAAVYLGNALITTGIRV
jgi:energy-coupling factor transport system permease protein